MFIKSILIVLLISSTFARRSERIIKTERIPTEYNQDFSAPEAFTWGDVNGTNYLTKSQNQHIPQYCGSCWAFGGTSALSDRLKIQRGADKIEFFLSVQYILNCGDAGSCYGGDEYDLYKWAQGKDWPLDTANPYIACSSDSKEGFCPHVNTKCSALNTARACGTFGQACVGLDHYPNVTVESFGHVNGTKNMQQEIYKRGPIACGINSEPILDYRGGVYDNSTASHEQDHTISVVGWGKDESTGKQYWIIRNSWGQYWGELGYIKVAFGTLGVDADCSWATIKDWTEMNYPCNEDGGNCKSKSIAY